ncbi:MAG: hypothetical protein EKK37_17335 [Sphingobacteriales bacterium]|nr:MAG: hypothetical protein EKK37_17335 [Sphingobacteriales bacterium]
MSGRLVPYKRYTEVETVGKSKEWSANGCNSWTMYNSGNVNVTIFNALILGPGEAFSSPSEHPDVQDYSKVPIHFDLTDTLIEVYPNTSPGAAIKTTEIDVVPPADPRLLIFKSFIH